MNEYDTFTFHTIMIFWGICIAIVMTIFGQLFRIPLLGGTGILLLDAWIPVVVCVWAFQKLWKWGIGETFSFPFEILKKPFFLGGVAFLGIALGSLLWNAQYFSLFTLLESGFYLFRYAFLILFFVVIADEVNTFSRITKLLYIFLLSSITLVIFGFLQLVFFPNFTFMQVYGWDPHIGRLLSTWFDPNFFAGFLAFSISIFMGILVFSPLLKKIPRFSDFLKNKRDMSIFFLMLVFLLALILTLSRSGFLAFAVVGFLFGIFFFRKLFVIGLFGLLLLLPVFPKSVERISDGVSSLFSVVREQESIFLPDATARLRVQNMQEALEMRKKNEWIGLGFNTLRFYRGEGIHSSGGFDTSLFTIVVTTGWVGLFCFLLFFGGMIWESVLQFRNPRSNTLKRGIALGFAIGSVGIFVHSFFVNTLFFGLFLVFLFGIFGILHSKGWETIEK